MRIIQFVYNNTLHESTVNIPFYLIHSRHAKFPLINLGNQQVYEHHQSPSQSFCYWIAKQIEFGIWNCWHHEDYWLQGEEKLLQAWWQGFDIQSISLSLLKKLRKLMFDWLGPFVVTSVNSESTVNLKVTTSNKTIINVHISRHKKFNEPVWNLFYILSTLNSITAIVSS